MSLTKPRLSFWSIININVGIFGIQYSFGLQQTAINPLCSFLHARPEDLPILNLAGPLTGTHSAALSLVEVPEPILTSYPNAINFAPIVLPNMSVPKMPIFYIHFIVFNCAIRLLIPARLYLQKGQP